MKALNSGMASGNISGMKGSRRRKSSVAKWRGMARSSWRAYYYNALSGIAYNDWRQHRSSIGKSEQRGNGVMAWRQRMHSIYISSWHGVAKRNGIVAWRGGVAWHQSWRRRSVNPQP